MERLRCRYSIPLAVALIAAAGWGWVLISPGAPEWFGWEKGGRFLDLRGSLSVGEYAHQGGDPYAQNPLDPVGRRHMYSNWWLVTGRWWDRTDTDVVGFAMVGLLLVACVAHWRPRDRGEGLIALAVLVSPAWLFAVYRGNNDVVVFLLLIVAMNALTCVGLTSKTAGTALTAVAVVLKYFPLGAVIGVLRARTRRELLLLVGLALAVLAVGYPSLWPAFGTVRFNRGGGFGLQTFGAPMLARLGAEFAVRAVWWALALGLGLVGWWLGKLVRPATEERAEARAHAAMGCATLALAFALGPSYNYKLILLWPILPWLYREGRTQLGTFRATTLLILALLACWLDGLAAASVTGAAAHLDPKHALAMIRSYQGVALVTQGVDWVIIGACVRVAGAWAAEEVHRLRMLSA